MKKITWLSIGAIALLAGITITLVRPTQVETSPRSFTNEALGISFTYPANYHIETRESGSAERLHYTISLVDAATAQELPTPGEGPTAITFDFYQNNLDKLSITDWVMGNSSSNFKLSGTKIAPLVFDGTEAFTYSWDGLYRGVSGAITHGDWILIISRTTIAPEDQIAKDFDALIQTLKLTQPLSLAFEKPEMCIQVITPAQNLITGETREFGTPCEVPPLWKKI